jgi:predicted amidohydrolase YtcJ
LNAAPVSEVTFRFQKHTNLADAAIDLVCATVMIDLHRSLKMFADGALPHTAAMIDPYIGEPDNYGITTIEKEEMIDLMSRASAAGLPSTVHAIGDRAIHDVLDGFEIVRAEEARRGESRASRRHRIEHVQVIHPNDVHRFAEFDDDLKGSDHKLAGIE